MDTTDIDSVLITGGTGFVGLHCCRRFQDVENVTAIDLQPFNPEDDPCGAEYVQGDIRDREVLEAEMDNVDVVIHAASAIPTWDDTKIYNATIEGTETVLEVAHEKNVEQVIHISSAAVYGPREPPAKDEQTTLTPRSVYGKAKAKSEQVVEEYRDRGLCVTVLRPQALIGPQRLGVFQILFDWVESGASIPLIGSGENRYQLIHVHDFLDAIELLTEADRQTANQTYNVGAAEFGSMKEDFQYLLDYAGEGKRVLPFPSILPLTALRFLTWINRCPLYPSLYETADEDTYISVNKLQVVGWEPTYSNKEALVHTYDWYRQQQDIEYSDDAFGNRASQDQQALKQVKKVFQHV